MHNAVLLEAYNNPDSRPQPAQQPKQGLRHGHSSSSRLSYSSRQALPDAAAAMMQTGTGGDGVTLALAR